MDPEREHFGEPLAPEVTVSTRALPDILVHTAEVDDEQ